MNKITIKCATSFYFMSVESCKKFLVGFGIFFLKTIFGDSGEGAGMMFTIKSNRFFRFSPINLIWKFTIKHFQICLNLFIKLLKKAFDEIL